MANRRLTLLVGVALLIAALGLARVASNCEFGWSFVLTQWQDASLGLARLGHISIGHSAPSEQAQFWLNEVHRIVDDYPNSASIHMGAAWILDSPGMGFLENHIRQSEFAHALPQIGLELDEKAVSDAKAEFRDKCLDRCLELARIATQNDATDVRWWRMRALLLFEGDTFYSGQEFEPRIKGWLAILDECKRHDPENALYDYLAANQLWNESASYDLSEQDDWTLTIHDPDKFALGLGRFVTAQQLPFLAIGEAGCPSISDYLANSRLRKTGQAEVAVSRLVTFRHSTLFLRLWRWQNVRAGDARRASDNEREMTVLRQFLRFYDQAIYPAETSALNTLTKFGGLRRHVYEAVLELHSTDPAAIASDQLETVKQREEELRITSATLKHALQTLDEGTYPKEYAASWDAAYSAVTSTSAAALFIVAGVFLFVGRMLFHRNDAVSSLGVLRHLVVWTAGCGIAFVVLGMVPAEMISHEAQRLAITSGIWLLATCIYRCGSLVRGQANATP